MKKALIKCLQDWPQLETLLFENVICNHWIHWGAHTYLPCDMLYDCLVVFNAFSLDTNKVSRLIC